MRTRAKQKFVAKATALGARVPRVELFVTLSGKGGTGNEQYKRMQDAE